MRKIIAALSLSLLLMLGGCIVPSLHPLYTDEDLVFEPALLGTWGGGDSEESLEFIKSGEKAYKFIYTDKKNDKGEFIAHLVKIKDRMFLDLYPENIDLPLNDLYEEQLLRVHTFMLVWQIEPTLKVSFLEADWLKKYLAQKPSAVAHEKVEDQIVLTAPPKELQKFFARHLTSDEAFTEPGVFAKN